jgi:hypothetical protein
MAASPFARNGRLTWRLSRRAASKSRGVHDAHSDTTRCAGGSDNSAVLDGDMDKSWFSRPEIVIPSVLMVWIAAAAVYATVFSY